MEEIVVQTVDELTHWDRAVFAAQIVSGVGLIVLIGIQLWTLSLTRAAVRSADTLRRTSHHFRNHLVNG